MTTLETPSQTPASADEVATPFTIAVDNRAEESTVTLGGALDMASAPQLEDALASLCSDSKRTTLDCSGLTFCDSAGLSALIRAHQRHQADGRHLTLTASPHVLQRLLTMTGLDDYLDTAATTATGPDAA